MKVIICDDEQRELDKYSALIKKIADEQEILLELRTYTGAAPLLFAAQDVKFEADVIYMDIHMPGMAGDEAARGLRALGYANDIVFLTVSVDHFEPAFDVKALHYIVKGRVSEEKFRTIFMRSVEAMEERHQEYARYVGGGESRMIKINTIRYFEINHKIVTVHYGKDNTFEFPQSSLGTIEDDFSGYGFVRIHRSYLVAVSAIDKFRWRIVTLKDGTALPLGNSQYEELKKIFDEKSTAEKTDTIASMAGGEAK